MKVERGIVLTLPTVSILFVFLLLMVVASQAVAGVRGDTLREPLLKDLVANFCKTTKDFKVTFQ